MGGKTYTILELLKTLRGKEQLNEITKNLPQSALVKTKRSRLTFRSVPLLQGMMTLE